MFSITQNFAMHDLETPVAVVAHDAGAANLIIAWVRAWGRPVNAYMEGPALTLWKTALPNQLLCTSLEKALKGSSSVVTGTGWASRLEHEARILARRRGLYSVAVLDHWINYRIRFFWGNELFLPDELWVADKWALSRAQREIPNIPVRLFDNLYLQDQLAQISAPPSDGTVLYISEPVRETWGRDQEGEFQALEYALEHLDCLCSDRVSRILLRSHPSEAPEKYFKYVGSDKRIEMDVSKQIAQSISLADLVVGVESFALTVALAAGRPVYSSLPPWAPALRLPHLGIRQIRHLNSR